MMSLRNAGAQAIPTLSPGDVVVLDNLGSHKGKAACAAVRAQGAHLLFLPPTALT
jgi:transposase